MTALASLPTLSVQIAFNPTNLQTLTQTWTDVTQWVRDFSTSSGRQHFLDRIESSTIRMTLDNRTGYFLNGTTNGTGAVIRTRLPITVTATVGATTYPIFWGLTEAAEERTADQLNQDIILSATDNTKYLSLLYANRPNFYAQYVNATYDQNYYTLGTTGPNDQLGTNNGAIVGPVSLTQQGALLYSTDTCLDLTNGAVSTNVAFFKPFGSTQSYATGNSIDYWFVGQNAISQTIQSFGWFGQTFYLATSYSGEIVFYAAVANATIYHTGVSVVDGLWHHIGVSSYTSSGTTYLSVYADGNYTQIGSASGTQQLTIYQIGNNFGASPLSAYIDQVVVGNTGLTANNPNIINRWTAGKLLGRVISSGDRIAEVLVLAGFGSITAGAISPTNFYVNDVAWNQSATITSISGTGTTATATVSSNPWTTGQPVFISGNNYSGTITNITWASGTATVTMSATHAFVVGTNVTISGSSVSAYNGTWAVQTIGSNTFTFSSPYASSPGTGTGGTATGPSYYNGLATVLTATSSQFTFASTGTATISGGTASIESDGAFFVQGFQTAVTSSTALDLIQQVTDTDIGAFFQKPDGTFEFDTQAYLYTPTNNATPSGADIWSDTAASGVTTFYEPSTLQVLRDDADVWTTVKITAQNGTVQTYENTTAEPLYGYSTLTKSNVVSVTNEQANQEAIYLGNLYQSPLPRIGNVELRSETNNGANLTEMFKPYLNDQVLLNRTPNGASTTGTNPGAINSTMVIESIRHDFQADPGYWHSSFTLDPYPKRGQNSTPQTFFMLFDDATYGVFDSNNDYL